MARDKSEIRARWGLLSVSGIGAATFTALMKAAGSAGAVWDSPARYRPPLKPTQLKAVQEFAGWAAVDRDLDALAKMGAPQFWSDDQDYPELLRHVVPVPPAISVLSDGRPLLESPTVAVVGTRDPSSYGEETAFMLARDLALAGVTVVSGFALGIDSAAHKGALEGKGRTIGVLGCGLSVDYPKRTDGLREKIAACGALVSEFGPEQQPRPEYFRQRNRIISGLSLGVVVVEGTEDSGALVTARHAIEQNRLVFAVPGPVRQRRSAGPHRLLREGAILTESADDILGQIAPMTKTNVIRKTVLPVTGQPEKRKEVENVDTGNPFAGDALTARLWELLSDSVRHVDELAAKSGLDAAQTMSLLLEMELTGRVVQSAGMLFSRNNRRSAR